jgi:hypothetical protein
MGACSILVRATRRDVVLLTAMLVSACAGVEPFEPRNDRVEGPQRGLFSGEAGEFVIFRREDAGVGQQPRTPPESMAPGQVDEESALQQ